MDSNSVIAKIKTKFDLGYILELDDGSEAQLRVIEQRDMELEHHLAGTEERLYGKNIKVYIIGKSDRNYLVSQFSPHERQARKDREQNEKSAIEHCNIGDKQVMKVEKEYAWGYLCGQIDGFLAGVIRKPTHPLKIGEIVTTVIIEKAKSGAPSLEIVQQTAER